MAKIKGSKNKAQEPAVSKPVERRTAMQKAPREEVLVTPITAAEAVIVAEAEIDLSAKITERIYHPEDFPHDCPNPREDRDGFLRWLSKQQAKGLV